MPPKLLTYEEAATILGLSVSGFRKLVAKRKIEVVSLGHSAKRVRPAAIEKAIERMTRKAIP